ncbi:kinase-like protein [Hypoxylon cercidicola]|nr:kinase-like protein [Hypoxylon cercidicola]
MAPTKESLFSLEPLSPKAKRIVNNALRGDRNSHLVSLQPDGSPVFCIGNHASKSSLPGVLASLGNDDSADIYLDSNSISKFQASFEINPQSNMVMFVDHSSDQSSQVSGGNVFPFEYGRLPRQVVVTREINKQIKMGGDKKDHVIFGLIWHHDRAGSMQWINDLGKALISRTPDASSEDTPQATQMKLPPRTETRAKEHKTKLPYRMVLRTHIHTQTHTQTAGKMRYVIGKQVGCGGFGSVFESLNVDTGDMMAVKILHRPKETSSRLRIKTEIETLSKLRHQHVLEFVDSDEDKNLIAIFTGLKQGSLLSLRDKPEIKNTLFLGTFLFQMLQALDYIGCHQIIHMDVKPSNILYVKETDFRYRFQLADFGICLRAGEAKSKRGTRSYIAPEVWYGDGEISSKVDVWSLYVTTLYMTDKGVQEVLDRSPKNEMGQITRYKKVLELAPTAMTPYLQIQEMARYNPDLRATPAQMLVKCYGGNGLTTRGTIPTIPEWHNDQNSLRDLQYKQRKIERNIKNHNEKRRLVQIWDISTNDLSTTDMTSDNSEDGEVDEDEEEEPNVLDEDDVMDETDCTDDTIRMMEEALNEELKNEPL